MYLRKNVQDLKINKCLEVVNKYNKIQICQNNIMMLRSNSFNKRIPISINIHLHLVSPNIHFY